MRVVHGWLRFYQAIRPYPAFRSEAVLSTHTPITDVIEALAFETTEDQSAWSQALILADHEALRVLVSVGAVSEADALFEAVTRIAEDAFDYDKAVDHVHDAIREAANKLEIDREVNVMEGAKWRAAYALGLAVGLRLAGGVR